MLQYQLGLFGRELTISRYYSLVFFYKIRYTQGVVINVKGICMFENQESTPTAQPDQGMRAAPSFPQATPPPAPQNPFIPQQNQNTPPQPQWQAQTPPPKKGSKAWLWVLLVVLVVVAGGAAAYYFFFLPSDTNTNVNTETTNTVSNQTSNTVVNRTSNTNTSNLNTGTEFTTNTNTSNANQATNTSNTNTSTNQSNQNSSAQNTNSNVDTDRDGITDTQEAALGTDPTLSDSDGDDLGDFKEVYIYNTDPLNPDSDGDGYLDGEEVNNGYSPLGSGRLES